MSSPFFSVVIPTFNRASTISDTLQSVSNQRFRDFEIIVVDDGSTDATCDIVRSFEAATLIQQTNSGPGAARNTGVNAALGTYIAFLDSDDLWFPWTLHDYHAALTTFGAGFISGSGIEFTGDSCPEVEAAAPKFNCYRDYLEAGARGAWLGTCGVTIERAVLQCAGGFVGRNMNAEDSDLWLRLGEVSPFVMIDSPPSFAYRRSSESATGDLTKTVSGLNYLLQSEIDGAYPGGIQRRAERQVILGQHVRPACVACLNFGKFRSAWKLYFQSLSINLGRRRFRFVLGFPALAIKCLLRGFWR